MSATTATNTPSNTNNAANVNTNTNANTILDLETSPILGQTGFAVLDLQGCIVRSQSFQDQDCKILFQMLQESATLLSTSTSAATSTLDANGLRRLTVTFPQTRFLVTRDENYVYLVQTRV